MDPEQNAQQIGESFIRHYYDVLQTAPHSMSRFYGEQSTFVHDDIIEKPQKELESVVGHSAIQEKINSLNFSDAHARILNLTSLVSLPGSYVIQVTGELSRANKPSRTFYQTIILAPRPLSASSPLSWKDYYICNEIFRYESSGNVNGNMTGDETQIESKLESPCVGSKAKDEESEHKFGFKEEDPDREFVGSEDVVGIQEELIPKLELIKSSKLASDGPDCRYDCWSPNSRVHHNTVLTITQRPVSQLASRYDGEVTSASQASVVSLADCTSGIRDSKDVTDRPSTTIEVSSVQRARGASLDCGADTSSSKSTCGMAVCPRGTSFWLNLSNRKRKVQQNEKQACVDYWNKNGYPTHNEVKFTYIGKLWNGVSFEHCLPVAFAALNFQFMEIDGIYTFDRICEEHLPEKVFNAIYLPANLRVLEKTKNAKLGVSFNCFLMDINKAITSAEQSKKTIWSAALVVTAHYLSGEKTCSHFLHWQNGFNRIKHKFPTAFCEVAQKLLYPPAIMVRRLSRPRGSEDIVAAGALW